MTKSESSLRIAILGTRGIPARYGGFETFAEELALALLQRGHAVSVYGRCAFGASGENQYRGIKTISLPAVKHKYLETPLHALFSFVDLFRRRFDVVLLCNAANSPFAWLVRLRGLPLIINVDGIERKRAKWNWLGRLWYRLGERCSVLFATKIVADAKVIADYYLERYKCESSVIAYGARVNLHAPGKVLNHFGLIPNKYILYVSRLEPENNALGVIEAYNGLNTELPLVVVGDAPYAKQYISRLKALANPKVIFTGFQFGEAYQELRSNCYLYVQATEVGGTHPALVEAMAYGNCVLANDVPEHREVLADAGWYYQFNDFIDLRKKMTELLENLDQVRALGTLARSRAEEEYRWEKIADQYEELFREIGSSKK